MSLAICCVPNGSCVCGNHPVTNEQLISTEACQPVRALDRLGESYAGLPPRAAANLALLYEGVRRPPRR